MPVPASRQVSIGARHRAKPKAAKISAESHIAANQHAILWSAPIYREQTRQARSSKAFGKDFLYIISAHSKSSRLRRSTSYLSLQEGHGDRSWLGHHSTRYHQSPGPTESGNKKKRPRQVDPKLRPSKPSRWKRDADFFPWLDSL